MDNLTPKQRRFVDEYLVDSNATQAAIRATYARNSAKEQGCRLLTKANVAAAIQEGRAKLTAATETSAKRVLSEIASIAFTQECNVKISEKLKALELLGKYHKLFTDKVEHIQEAEPIPIITKSMSAEEASNYYMREIMQEH